MQSSWISSSSSLSQSHQGILCNSSSSYEDLLKRSCTSALTESHALGRGSCATTRATGRSCRSESDTSSLTGCIALALRDIAQSILSFRDLLQGSQVLSSDLIQSSRVPSFHSYFSVAFTTEFLPLKVELSHAPNTTWHSPLGLEHHVGSPLPRHIHDDFAASQLRFQPLHG